mgnify:CR=1 FL=1
MPTETVKRISPIAGQASLLTDFLSSVLAAVCGTGGGKTMMGYWWLHSRMEAMPGNTWLVAEPTFTMLDKVLINSSDPDRPSLMDYFKIVGHHPKWVNKQSHIMQTDFGKLYLGSADNPDSMQGAAVKGAWLDEAGQMRVGAYDTARQRVSMMQGQVLLTTTPYDLGWLLTDVWDSKGKGVHVESWRSIDRPGYPRERYEEEKRRLPPWRFAMMYDGRFERPAGLIYSAFNEHVCLIARFPIPPQWPVYVGHDFGTANPAALFTAGDPATGQFYHFKEYLPGPGRSTNEHVQQFKKLAEGFNVLRRVGGSHQEEEIRQGYTAHGWPITEPKVNKVETQIDKVIGMHQLNKVYVFDDMREYLDEKRSFSRELDEESQPTEKIKNEAKFHLMAAERYILSDFTPETVRQSSGRAIRIGAI